MTHFVFDCDDVLLDWQTGFSVYLADRNVILPADGPQDWDLSKWIGCSPEAARSWVLRFNASPSFSRLRAMPKAVETLWALWEAGHTASVLTACGKEPSLQQARAANLRDVFKSGTGPVAYSLPYQAVITLPLGESKMMALWDIHCQIAGRDDIVLVEDNFDHARSGLANGMTSFCLRRSHNRAKERDNPESDVIWIDNLDDLACRYVQPTVE